MIRARPHSNFIDIIILLNINLIITLKHKKATTQRVSRFNSRRGSTIFIRFLHLIRRFQLY